MEADIIVMDLGGTKCAAGLLRYEGSGIATLLREARVYLKDVGSLAALVAKLSAQIDYDFANAQAICVAAAGRYYDGAIHLEHGYPYPMPLAKLASTQGWQKMHVVHDYTPIACATFTKYSQQPAHLKIIQPGHSEKHGRRVVLGIGSGLGVKDTWLLQDHKFWLGENEAGHIGIPFPAHCAADVCQRHQALMQFLQTSGVLAEDEGISFESILSGKGLARLHKFFSSSDMELSAREISQRCNEPIFRETWACFAWYLGCYIATLQLVMMPSGGMWIAGGVLQQNASVFDGPDFHAGMQSLPAYAHERGAFPIALMLGHDHVYYGGAYYARHRML